MHTIRVTGFDPRAAAEACAPTENMRFQCPEYPCRRYDGIYAHDSLISHRNQKKDLLKAKEMGIDACLAEQRAKKGLLDRMPREYDDGCHQVFFCLAANMLDTADLEAALARAEGECAPLPARERAAHLKILLQSRADERGIPLILRY